MTLVAFLAIAPLLALGIGLVFWLWPDTAENAVRDLPLKLSLGFLIGPGLGSCIDYFWRLAGAPPGMIQLGIETLLAAAVLWAAARRKPWQGLKINRSMQTGWIDAAAVTLWGVLSAIFLVVFIQRTFVQPHGTFDAYAIWNQRARFLYILGPEWRLAFDPMLNWKFHADYPLMLPLNVVRIWTLAGNATLRAPMLLAFLFTAGLIGLLFAGLASSHRPIQAALAGCILAGTPWLLLIGTAQTADIPLTGFMLATAVLLWLSLTRIEHPTGETTVQRRIPDPWSILAGLCAGLAAWTKNEGMLFYLVAFLVFAFSTWQQRSWRKLGAFLLGGVLPLAVVISFKLWLAPPGDLFMGQTAAGILSKLADGSRYLTILIEMGRTVYTLGDWGFPMVLVLLGYTIITWQKPTHLSAWGLTVMLLVLTLAGYAGIYLITPHPLAWHLKYSADRLLFQVYPLFLFILFQVTTSPTEAGAALVKLIKSRSLPQPSNGN